MLINVDYTPSAQELAKASLLYVEKRPFFKFTVGFANIFMSLFIAIFVLKFFFMGLTLQEWSAAAFCLAWLLGRRPFNQWLLLRRMKNSPVIGKPIHIEMSLNGIAWTGKGLRPGSMNWEQFKHIIEVQNGFILPNSLTRFLWLPFRGFASPEQIGEFKNFLNQRQITRNEFKKWQC